MWSESEVGSYHYPVRCALAGQVEEGAGGDYTRWVFGKVDWSLFEVTSNE